MKTSKIKNKSNKHRSLKGKRGTQVGAPPKSFRLPKSSFTMAQAFITNKNQCHLSVRKKVDAMIAAGSLIQLIARKQAGGGVGRPKAVFVKLENFDATKHNTLSGRQPKAQTIAVPMNEPVAALPHEPVVPTPAPVIVEENVAQLTPATPELVEQAA